MQKPSTERLQLARELHDGIAQELVSIGYSLDLILGDESLEVGARADIRSTRLSIDSLIAKVRREILNLRSDESRSLPDQIRSIASPYSDSHKLTLTLEEVSLSDGQIRELVAITTEILRNVDLHARATHIGIHLYPINNRTCLEVIDNGIGGAKVRTGRYGLQGITERIHQIGGSITIESIEGTRIAILV